MKEFLIVGFCIVLTFCCVLVCSVETPAVVRFLPGTRKHRPPPPIQMYSIDDSPEDHRGPIYDTINDDNSSHSQSTYSQSSDSAYPRSTFTPGQGQNGSPPGAGGQANNGYANDYDVPEGNERPGSRGNSSVGTVTINGIAV